MPPNMVDPYIEIVSQADEIRHGRNILEGKYDINEDDGHSQKIFHTIFFPPEPNENLVVLFF